MAKGNELTGIKRTLFFGAIEFGLSYDPMKKLGLIDSLKLGFYRKLIFSKWKEALGGRVRLIASGSAALQPRLSRVFWAAGIPISEGYGLTETSPVISISKVNPPDFQVGCVGSVLDCVEVKIAEDGEILVKGTTVMVGYYKRPDLTAETIIDGWLHTGDIVVEEAGGFLKITDRKKELFKTSGGKYVAPQPVENKMKESPFIEQIMLIGDNRRFVSALIVPSFAKLKEWTKQNGIAYVSNTDIINNTKLLTLLQGIIDEYNKLFNQVEQIKKFALIPREWNIDNGEMTPKLSLRRKVVLANFEKEIEAMYL
jgi:long-chain acyl-CoA synthetase